MDLFVYGTLQNEQLMQAVAGDGVLRSSPATLEGYSVLRLTGDVVPKITPGSDKVARGLLFQNLSEAQIARLDLFEGAFGYFREEKSVHVDGDLKPAQVYLPPSEERLSGDPWDLADWEEKHLTPMLYAAENCFHMIRCPIKRVCVKCGR